MKRYDIINKLISKYGYKSYLEIGLASGETFSRIEVEHKESVDPNISDATHIMTSDSFFQMDEFLSHDTKYDIIFIDGLHHSEQVDKDIANSVLSLRSGGTIVIHDCNPTNEKMQMIPRDTRIWTGDVWKSFVKFVSNNCDFFECFVVDTDYGCGIIRDGRTEYNLEVPEQLTYKWLDENREEALNLISIEKFEEIC